MSTTISLTLSQSKHWINGPKVKLTTRCAMPVPGQALLPNPNGMNLCDKSSPFSNLSGLKLSGLSHNLWSLCMAHAFTNTVVPSDTSNPPIVQSPDEKCGTNSGTGGYNRRVSEMILCMQRSLEMSCSFTKHSWPTWASNSTLAFFNTCGWLRRLDIAHSNVTDDVSVPANNNIKNTCLLRQLHHLLLIPSVENINPMKNISWLR